MGTLANLQETIKELKSGRTLSQIKKEDKKLYYKIQNLSSKLSQEKARAKGQFITKEHLSEYKPLIIWLLKNKCNFRGYLNLKSAMTEILNTVENEEIIFITEKGIKGIISRLAISLGLENVEEMLRKENGIEINESTYTNELLSDFVDFKINALV